MKIFLLQIKLWQFGVSKNSWKKHSFTQQHTYIAILNDFLCIGVLMDFGEIKFMFLGEKLKQKFDDLKRLT